MRLMDCVVVGLGIVAGGCSRKSVQDSLRGFVVRIDLLPSFYVVITRYSVPEAGCGGGS